MSKLLGRRSRPYSEAVAATLYPQSISQKPDGGFPLMRLLAVWSVRSGTMQHVVKGNYHQNEMRRHLYI